MASAGTVTVDFAAETAKFTAELKRVNSSLKNLESGFNSAKQLASTFLGALSVGAMVGFAKAAFSAADSMADAAKRAGIAVDEFTRLRFAADQADVEFGAFTAGIQRFQIAMSKAGDNTKDAGVLFARFGVSAAALRDLPISEQLGIVADAFMKIKDPAEKTRIAVELFGKSAGPQLIPLLNEGRAGIAALTAEADRLGVTMSQSTADGIDAADAALKRLKATAQGFTATALGNIALGIERAVEAINGPSGEVKILQEQMTQLVDKRNAALKLQRSLTDDIANGSALLASFRAKQLAIASQEVLVATDMIGEVNDKLRAIGQREADKTKTELDAAAARTALWDSIQEIDLEPIKALRIVTDEYAEALNALYVEMGRIHDAKVQERADAAEDNALKAIKDTTAQVNAELEARGNVEEFNRDKQVAKEIAAQDAMTQARQDATSAGLQALQTFAGGSEKAAKALVLINKARAIATAIQNTYAGATLQLASGDPYTATFRAAAVVAFGLAQVAAIVKSGQGEMQQISASGGAPAGSPSNPINTQSAASANNPSAGAVQDSSLQVHIHGNFFGNRETVDYLMTQFREQINTRDVVLFSSGSRQAQELGGV